MLLAKGQTSRLIEQHLHMTVMLFSLVLGNSVNEVYVVCVCVCVCVTNVLKQLNVYMQKLVFIPILSKY